MMRISIDLEKEYFADVRIRKDLLFDWLRRKSAQVSAIIAVRLGFRVLPFVVPEPVDSRFTPKQSREILSAFRYAALGRLSIKHPSQGLDEFATLLNSIAYAGGTSATAAIREASRAISPQAPWIVPRFNFEDPVWISARRAAHAASFSAHTPAGSPWEAIAIDQTWIEAVKDPMVLLDQPKWLDLPSPNQVPEPHLSRWKLMRCVLDGEDENWKIWTNWYESCLYGAPAQPDHIEYTRLTLFPDAMNRIENYLPEGMRQWKADLEEKRDLLEGSPRKANRIAAQLIDKLKASSRD